MKPTIALVTCSFQQARYLDATIRSVLDQRYEPLEYVIMDGGSRDGSVDIIRRHAPRLAGWVSEKDAGQTDALIKGFARTRGEIMGWLCSDDLLLPGALERVASFFQSHPDVGAFYGDSIWIDQFGGVIRPKREVSFRRFPFLFDHNHVPQPSMFWRRSLYERVGGLDPQFNLAMDTDLWERFSRAGRIEHRSVYLSCMRYYPEQKTRALKPAARVEDARIRSRSPLGRLKALQPVLYPLAKASRVVEKALTGGYVSKIDEEILGSLQSYRIPA